MQKFFGKRFGKRSLSMFLVAMLLFSSVDMTVLATEPYISAEAETEASASVDDTNKTQSQDGADETTATSVLEGSDVTLNADNSLGRLLADVISEEDVQQVRQTGCNVYSVTMNGTEVTVSFQTVEDAVLVVGIYEEDGVKLLATGSTEVAAGDEEAVVSIETDSLPEYFYLKAYLVDAENLRPCCEVYESEDFTQKMQEFYAKTTDDFDNSHILNLDEDETNNFLVFSESVTVIQRGDDADVNQVVECDEENLIYQIQNPNEKFTSLKQGDIFAYYYADNETIITKISSITTSSEGEDTVLTIQGEVPNFDEVIEFIKVGAVNPKEVDNGQAVYALYANEAGSTGGSVPWSMEDKKWELGENGSLEVSDIGGAVAVKVYRDSWSDINSVDFEISYGANVKISAQVFEGEKRWELGNPTMPTNIPGVNVGCKIELKLAVEGSVDVEGSLSGSMGININRDGKVTNISRGPTFTVTQGMKVTISLGLVISPRLEFIHEDILSVSVEADIGLKLTITVKNTVVDTAFYRHLCETCLEITINPYLDIKGKGIVLLTEKKINLANIDFDKLKQKAYFSPEYSPHFGWGECPHWIYDSDVRVRYTNGSDVADATVITSVSEGQTDSEGKVSLRLNIGKQNIYIEKDGVTYSTSVNIPDDTDKTTGALTLKINKSQPLANSTYVEKVYAVGYYSNYRGELYNAAITKDGSLYMWGENRNGQLGIGSTANQDNPVKVLDKVKDFQTSLDGLSCAAITEDGSLYRWGESYSGTMGDGDTTSSQLEPYKVQFPKKGTKIEKFIFGTSNCAAIATDGQLYMWGSNDSCQINNSDDSIIPTPYPVINYVKEFYINNNYTCAAVTTDETDGKLFLWGYNGNSCAGQPASSTKVAPQDVESPILDHVSEVYLGDSFGAAIRADGSLWMWGKGDGFTTGGYDASYIYSRYEELDSQQIWNSKELISQSERFSHFYSDGSACAAVTTDGGLYMWGQNAYGQLGTEEDIGSHVFDNTLHLVEEVNNVKDFSILGSACAAVTTDGRLYMWGRNDYGQLGDGTYTSSGKPTKVLPDKEVQSFEFLFDGDICAALTKSEAGASGKDLYMWGNYWYSSDDLEPQFALGKVDRIISYPKVTWSNLGTGYSSSAGLAVIQTDGAVYQCFNSEMNPIEGLEEAIADISCGTYVYDRLAYRTMTARGKDGGLYTWGSSAARKEYLFGTKEIMKELKDSGNTAAQTSLLEASAEFSLQLLGVEDDSDSSTTEGSLAQTADFSDLLPNEIYNIYAMKSRTAEDVLGSDNLLYIGQMVSDDSGNLHIEFEMKESYAEPEIFCVGLRRRDLSEAEVEVSDIVYDGDRHIPEVTVTYNGKVLIDGTDYKAYLNDYAVEVGEYELTVRGIGLYYGEKTVKFHVKEKEDDTPGGDVSGGDVSGGDVTGGDVTGGDVSGGDVSGGNIPGGDVSGGNIPGGDVSGGDVSGGDNTPGGDDHPEYGDILPGDIPADGKVPDGLWIAGVAEDGYYYTGSAIKPEVRVYDHDTLLKEQIDYTIAYKNNTKVNDASAAGKAPVITVTGKGNYTGKDTKTFRILPLDISSEDGDHIFEADDISVVYSSKAQKPTPELYWNGKKLKNKTDYTFTYHEGTYSGTETSELDSVKEAGSYYIKLTGNGNFTGTRRVKLSVLSTAVDGSSIKLISKVKVAKIPNQSYQTQNKGGVVTPEVTINDGKTLLTKDVHYTVTYSNNTKVGTAYAIIKGKEEGGYSGTKRVAFKITGVAISKATVNGLTGQTFVYGGMDIEPQLTLSVKQNGTDTPLVKGTDYSVQWQKNQNAGTATVIFTGKNGYTGTLKKTFKIKAFNIAENKDGHFKVKITDDSVPYAKGGAKPELTVTFQKTDGTIQTLKEGTDYTATCKNNKALNDGSNTSKLPTLTIKGKGNFTGTYSEKLTYKITAQDISRLKITAVDKTYQNKSNIYSTKVTITDLDGKVLKAGTDYDKNLAYTYKMDTTLDNGTLRPAGTAVDKNDIIPAGTVISVSVAPKGNYTGTPLSGEYSIKTYDLSGAKVTIPKQTYTGKAITLDKTDEKQILVTVKGQKVDPSQYEIANYDNNVKKGTATVTIKGIDNYGGTKTVKFTIKAKGFSWWWNK